MNPHQCLICLGTSSVFWWPFSFGEHSGEICDGCVHALRKLTDERRGIQ